MSVDFPIKVNYEISSISYLVGHHSMKVEAAHLLNKVLYEDQNVLEQLIK